MENVNMDQLKKEMENAPSMDEAINSIFGNDNAVKNLAEILGDFISRYNEMGNDIPIAATKLKSTPPKLKKVIDAYARLHEDLNNARELAHQIVGMLGTDPDDFDHMVMKRVLENASNPAESAGDDDAQPTE